MAANFDIDSRAFTRELLNAYKGLELSSVKELEHLADIVVERGEQRAPKRTGRLGRSVDKQSGKDASGPYVDVFAAAFYARFSEFGTSQRPARPFMRPALAEAVNGFGRRVGY